MYFFTPAISIKDKALFYENVANLLEWWVSLIATLKWLRDRIGEGALHDGIDNLIFFVEWWDSINIAMRKLPNFFYEQEIAIVESGEQTGLIQQSFLAIARDLRSQEELRNKIIGALIYPLIIMIFLFIALCVVMIYVIPQLMPIIGEMTGDLPWTTRSLVGTSHFFKEYFVYIILLIVAISLFFQGYTHSDMGRRWWDREKIYFPLSGKVYKNYLIVRVMSTFHLLSASGISIIKTLRLTGASAGNKIIEELFITIADDVAHGTRISGSMKDRDPTGFFFSPDILQMIESAEKTSTLSTIIEKIAVQYKREVDNALSTMVKFIEPVALLIAALFVLWFALSIFSAIMQIVTLAGN